MTKTLRMTTAAAALAWQWKQGGHAQAEQRLLGTHANRYEATASELGPKDATTTTLLAAMAALPLAMWSWGTAELEGQVSRYN